MVTTRTNLTSRRYRGRVDEVSLIGIHTMEAPEGSQTAENVAAYFQRVDASSHWTVDDDSRVRVVRDEDTAWTLPGANARSLNIEIAGYARQSADDWRDAFSLKALNIAALCGAEWCKKYGIPVRRLSDAQIRAEAPGFAGHVDVNRVYRKSSHWDPGPNFPWTYFLGLVRDHLAALKGGKPVPAPADPGWDNRGYSMAWIREQQEKLNKVGYDIVVDGKRGKATIAATKDFQAKHGLEADGIPGPATSKKLDAAIGTKAPAKPAPAKPATGVEQIDEDGKWGSGTTRALQDDLGSKFRDGEVSRQNAAWRDANPGLTTGWEWLRSGYGDGSPFIEDFQQLLNEAGFSVGPVDGLAGEKFFKGLQRWLDDLGLYDGARDGQLWKPSTTIKALQRAHNKGLVKKAAKEAGIR